MLQNDRLIKALKREPVDCTPVWMMRQAGRYLPEYRATREKAGSFLNLCKTPELACAVTLQPVQRFALDAAILFSDILVIPEALGLGLEFVENEGPKINRPIASLADVQGLAEEGVLEKLEYVFSTIKLLKHELANRIPLIGFAGSPWTLACYMVEGQASRNFHAIKSLLYLQPQLLQQLLDTLTKHVAAYLQEQIHAGVDAVMLFDTWGGILSQDAYLNFSLHFMQKIVTQLKSNSKTKHTPIILFTKNSSAWLELMAETGCDGLSIDWTYLLGEARRRVGNKVALQGNLDPAILLTNPTVIQREVANILQSYGKHPGHIFNLGHGITPDISPENVAYLVDAVHRLSS